MKKFAAITALLVSSNFANAEVCGRFTEPIKSILKQTTELRLDFKKISPPTTGGASACFYYTPRGVRCDLIYDNRQYFFFFNDQFSKSDVENGTVELYFMRWLKNNETKKITVNTYNTLFEVDNDYEDVECSNWYEELTYTLTIEGNESVVLE